MKNDNHICVTDGAKSIGFPGGAQRTLCGLDIIRPQVQAIWDDFPTGDKFSVPPENTILLCRKCLVELMQPNDEKFPVTVWAITERRQDEQSTDTTAQE